MLKKQKYVTAVFCLFLSFFFAAMGILQYQMIRGKKPVSTDAGIEAMNNDTVLVGGMPIGIYMETDGVLILDTQQIKGIDGKMYEPAQGMVKSGDYIKAVNQKEICGKKELLKELSDFSHAQTVTLVPVNPAEFLTTVLSCQKNTLDYLGIRLEIHVEHTSSPVFLDRIKMRQVIFNLIKNSCEAIDQPGGKIIVNLTPADSGICICIKDNGCGMTHKQTENIFHPFITYKPEGTGLGLAVTAEIISAHHGQIRVSSTPGQGSAFYIYLPASPE